LQKPDVPGTAPVELLVLLYCSSPRTTRTLCDSWRLGPALAVLNLKGSKATRNWGHGGGRCCKSKPLCTTKHFPFLGVRQPFHNLSVRQRFEEERTRKTIFQRKGKREKGGVGKSLITSLRKP